MSIQVLIAVESCNRDRERGFHDAIRETWFRDICVSDKRFFYGSSSRLPEADEVELHVDDSYAALSLKTQLICGWALEKGFDWVFKCDNDTLVNPREFPGIYLPYYDYVGGENADVNVPGFPPERIEFASGGAGYFLSRKAMMLVSKANVVGTAEDVFVAHTLLQHGIKPHFDPRFKWRPGSVLDKETVSFHLSSAHQVKYEPKQMVYFYEELKRMIYA
jgi:hypothetical protein